MELTNSQIADEERSPVETASRRVVAEEKDGGNGLAKARGTFVKAGGPLKIKRLVASSTWRQGSRHHAKTSVS